MNHNLEILREKGNQNYLAGRYPEALQDYREASLLAPNNATLHYDIGCVHLKMNAATLALEEWDQAAHLSPNDSNINLAMARAYYKIGREKHAQEYQALVSRFPKHNASRELARGWLAADNKDYKQALTHYQNVMIHHPNAPYLNGHLGYVLLQLGRDVEAREAYLSAVKNPTPLPAAPQAFYNLAIAENRLGNSVAAIEALKQAIHVDGSYFKAYSKLAAIEIRLGRWRSAWKHFGQSFRYYR